MRLRYNLGKQIRKIMRQRGKDLENISNVAISAVATPRKAKPRCRAEGYDGLEKGGCTLYAWALLTGLSKALSFQKDPDAESEWAEMEVARLDATNARLCDTRSE